MKLLLNLSFLLVSLSTPIIAQQLIIEIDMEHDSNLETLKNTFCEDETVNELSSTFWANYCHFFIRFKQYPVDIDNDGDLDIITNLYETAYGKHGLGIIRNNTQNGIYNFELSEMYHLNGDHPTLQIGDFDGNGHIDFYSPTVNYHGNDRFNGFLPDFYRGHPIHPNQIVYRFEDRVEIDTLESTDPFTTQEDFLMTGFNQTIYDMNQDGKDDIFEILGDHGLVYTWDKDKKEMWPVDTLYSGSENVAYKKPIIFDANGDGFDDLVYVQQNKIQNKESVVVNLGSESGITLVEDLYIFELDSELNKYDVIDFQSIQLNNNLGKEILIYYGKNVENDDLPGSEISLYKLDFESGEIINVTSNYLPENSNLDWTTIGNGVYINDYNNDGLEDLFFPNSHCYIDQNIEYCSDIAIFDGIKFHFSKNRTDRASDQFPIDLDGDGLYEVFNSWDLKIGSIKVNFNPLSEPKLKSPLDDASQVKYSTDLIWFNDVLADSFQVQLSQDGFKSFILNHFVSDTIINTPDLDFYTTYTWRVRGIDNSGIGEWSDIWSFSTGGPSFYLHNNGVTIVCKGNEFGETGIVNGITYTKRSKDDITTENASTTCTSDITNMNSLFESKDGFNSDVSHWDVSSVEYMNYLFAYTNEFNQDLSHWDVSNVKFMNMLFSDTKFNQDISNWDVSNVIQMNGMFGATPFNYDIGGWDISNVEDISSMFLGAKSFNYSLNDWDISKVTRLDYMFSGATAFNQDLSNWNVENVELMDYIITNSGIDERNYSKLLIGWGQQNVKSGLNIDVNYLKFYPEASVYRDKLINDFGWSIIDAGPLDNNGFISISDINNKQGFNSKASISIHDVQILDELFSIQFDLNYPDFAVFKGIDSTGLSDNYTFEINNLDSVIRVALISDSIISKSENLFDVIFSTNRFTSEHLEGKIDITNGLFNTTNVDSTVSGDLIFSPVLIGDSDDSGSITAFDAAIVLNKSIGVEILDDYSDKEWEEWRSYVSDTDKDGKILAIDATYILQKVVGLIEEFPTNTQSVESVIIEVSDKGLKIIAPEEIQSLNVSIQRNEGFKIKEPIIYWENSTTANYSNGTFDLAIASSGSLSGEILEIPMDVFTSDDINFEVITYSNNTKQIHSVVVNSKIVNSELQEILPKTYGLNQNYPNPFNPSTQIHYALPEATQVTLEVFNSLGQKVMELVNGQQLAGYHTATFNASALSSGVYLYKLTTPSFTETKKMLLIK